MSAAPWAPAPPPETATGDTGDCACRRPEGEPLPRPWPRMSEAERAAWLARNLTDEARAAGERAQRDAEEAAASAETHLGRFRPRKSEPLRAMDPERQGRGRGGDAPRGGGRTWAPAPSGGIGDRQ